MHETLIASLESALPDDFSKTLLDSSIRVLADPKNKVRLNHFASSIRELYTHVLNTLAPDAEIRKCVWFPEQRAQRARDEPHRAEADLDKPTRRQRAIYATQGGLTDKQLTEYGVDIEGLHSEFIKSIDELSKHTHVKPNTLVEDAKEIERSSKAALVALADFFAVLQECRDMIEAAILDAVHEQAFEELTREEIGDLDILSTHTYVEGPLIEDIEISSIDAEHIHYEVSGEVEVELNYGSSSDFRNGDGVSLSDSFPFNLTMRAPVANPKKFEDVVCTVDTSRFYQ